MCGKVVCLAVSSFAQLQSRLRLVCLHEYLSAGVCLHEYMSAGVCLHEYMSAGVCLHQYLSAGVCLHEHMSAGVDLVLSRIQSHQSVRGPAAF